MFNWLYRIKRDDFIIKQSIKFLLLSTLPSQYMIWFV